MNVFFQPFDGSLMPHALNANCYQAGPTGKAPPVVETVMPFPGQKRRAALQDVSGLIAS
jgi:hypothetical protein